MPYTDQITEIAPYVRIYYYELPSNISIMVQPVSHLLYISLRTCLGLKLLYERSCPSVSQSLTSLIMYFLFAFIYQNNFCKANFAYSK